MRLKLFCLNNIIWIVNIGLFIAFSIFGTGFLSISTMCLMAAWIGLIGFLILAEAIVLLVGEFDFSVTAIAAFSVALPASIFITFGWSWPLPFIAIGVGILIGFLNGYIVTKFSIVAFLETLGMFIILYGLVVILVPQVITGLPAVFIFMGSAHLNMFGLVNIPLSIITFSLTVIVLHIFLTKTILGQKMYAVGSNREAAKRSGINIRKVVIIAFMLSGMLSGIAGLHYMGYQEAVTRDTCSADELLPILAATVIGGIALAGGAGKISGVVGGVLLIAIFKIGIVRTPIPVAWNQWIFGFILLIGIIIVTVKEKLRKQLLTRSF